MVSSGTILYPQGMLQDAAILNESGMFDLVWSIVGDSISICFLRAFDFDTFLPPHLLTIIDPIVIAGDGLTFCCRPVGCTNGMLTDQPRASCVSRWQPGGVPTESTFYWLEIQDIQVSKCFCSSWKGRSWFIHSLGLIGLAMMDKYYCTWPEARAKQTWAWAKHLNFFSSVVTCFVALQLSGLRLWLRYYVCTAAAVLHQIPWGKCACFPQTLTQSYTLSLHSPNVNK